MQIRVSDLPVRIEAALQVDYYYTDYYAFISSSGGADLVYFYLYDGCSQRCASSVITIRVSGLVVTMNSRCLFYTVNENIGINIHINTTRGNVNQRYALVVARGPMETGPHNYTLDCDSYYRSYDYSNPPLPSTANAGFGRTICTDGPVIPGEVHSAMGPFSIPFAGNSLLQPYSFDFWKVFVNVSGTYDFLLLQTEGNVACESDSCGSNDPIFRMYDENYNYITSRDDTGPGLCPLYSDYLTRGYYYIKIGYYSDSDAGPASYTLFASYTNSYVWRSNCQPFTETCRRFVLPPALIPRSSGNVTDSDDDDPNDYFGVIIMAIVLGLPFALFLAGVLAIVLISIFEEICKVSIMCCCCLACYKCCKACTRGARKQWNAPPGEKTQKVELGVTRSDFPNGVPPDAVVVPVPPATRDARDFRDPEVSTTCSSSGGGNSLPVQGGQSTNVSLEDKEIDATSIYNQAIGRN